MAVILAGIHSLTQHLQQLNSNPEAYRPKHCPHCGCAGLWCHGYYLRLPDRENSGPDSLNPIPILRFFCPQAVCRRSCSVLPECIAPRRWYLWSVQQAMLLLLFTGRLSDELQRPHVRTVWRWWARLKERFDTHRFCLCSRNALLGQYATVRAFWQACFELMPFSSALLVVYRYDEAIP